MSSAFEAFLTIQCVLTIAALGHSLPLSMKQLDVGIAGYMAIGAYVSAILTRDFGLSFPLAIAAGMVAAAASSLLVDMLAARVRLSGFAYAIFAISFAESLRIILNNNDRVGGALGLAGIQHHTTLTGAAIALTIVILGFWALDRSRLGQLRTAIKDDEFIVPQLGVPLLATKLAIFAIGAALGGLAGGLYAHYVLFIRPDDFGFLLLVAIMLPIVFGGLDRFWGAILGTWLMGIIPELFRELGEYRLLLTAAATILLLVLRPGGLITNRSIDWIKAQFHGRPVRGNGDGKGYQHGELVMSVAAQKIDLHDGSADGLTLDNVSVAFGGVKALSDVSLTIAGQRGIEAIIGPNGAGKTTLFNVLTGVVTPTAGRLLIDGRDMTGRRPDHVFRRGVSRTFQGVRLFTHLTAEQNVAIAAQSVTGRAGRAEGRLTPGWFDAAKGRARTKAALDRVGIPDEVRGLMPPQLSLWERRMIEIARAISSEPSVLLLDEPAAGLNTVEKTRLRDLLITLADQLDCHLLVVEHDMSFVMSIARHVRVLNFGRLLAEGTPAEVQANPEVREAYLGTNFKEIEA